MTNRALVSWGLDGSREMRRGDPGGGMGVVRIWKCRPTTTVETSTEEGRDGGESSLAEGPPAVVKPNRDS